MKRKIALAFLAAVAAASASAQLVKLPALPSPSKEAPAGDSAEDSGPSAPSFLTADAGTGIFYNAYPIPDNILGFLSILYSFRGGGWVGTDLRVSEDVLAGVEAGAAYMTLTLASETGETATHLIDLPLRLRATYRIGPFAASFLCGSLVRGVVQTGETPKNVFEPSVEVGGRLSFANFFAEGSYVIGFGDAVTHPRFGAGLRLDLLR